MKKLFILTVITFIGYAGYGQKFENQILKTLDYMTSNANNDNVIEKMKLIGLNLKSENKDKEGNRLVDFEVPNGKLSFFYSGSKKLIYIRIDLPKVNAKILIPLMEELKKNEFKRTNTRTNTFTEEPMTVEFRNPSYPYIFIFYDIYELNYSVYAFNYEFGSLEDYELK